MPRHDKAKSAAAAQAATPSLLPPDVVASLLSGAHANPHSVLGPHADFRDGMSGVVVRALAHGATQAWVISENQAMLPMTMAATGLFECFVPDAVREMRYTLRLQFADDAVVEAEDPYRFASTVGDMDLHLIGEGTHLRLWEVLGAQLRTIDGVSGTSFAVWAPGARGVSVIGSFNGWQTGTHPMRKLNDGGIWELFLPAVKAGDAYKFALRPMAGPLRIKTDPLGFAMEQQPGNASIVTRRETYQWQDTQWIEQRAKSDPVREPMLVYEVHLGSWRQVAEENNRALTYREIAPLLAAHCAKLGFTHVELMPVQEHPYGGSWGYQVSGYYAPTSRYGTPDDFRFFVDTLHQAGIGVLLDWVPAHFPKDDFALRRFDGTACSEHEDPRLAEHPEWGTLIFNYGRHEVRNFLLANALYWIEEFHLDGIRVDAVASMLYLDYGREAGQWMRNRLGGRENLEAVTFIRQLNHTVRSLHPGVVTIAEESTTWPRVTHAIKDGGLGFTFKWNMGWMHDTLDYFRVDPLFRRGAHNQLTFAMMYEYSERFVNPLSHDEVVHLKRSLLQKMPGDLWRKFANLRTLLLYSILRPGKTLLFMGTELAPHREWNHDVSLEWHLLDDPPHAGVMSFMQALGALYREHSCFWRLDHEPSGFSWIDVADREQSVVSFVRRDGASHAVVVLNLTPVPRTAYRIGAPAAGKYRYQLSSDDERFGGSGFERPEVIATETEPYHGFAQSMLLDLPPLCAIVLLPEPGTVELAAETASVPLGVPVPELLQPVKKLRAAKPKSGAGKKAAAQKAAAGKAVAKKANTHKTIAPEAASSEVATKKKKAKKASRASGENN